MTAVKQNPAAIRPTDGLVSHHARASLGRADAYFMMNAGSGSYEAKMRGPFQEIALQTGGWYTEESSDIWPMLHALETAFDVVASLAEGFYVPLP